VRISDLVEVPPVQTVIRLDDLSTDASRRRLLTDFVLTAETGRALATFLGEIAGGQPQGHFLTGNYGSGKSHFLAVAAALLEEPALRSGYLADTDALLDPVWELMGERRFLVVTVSLVEHAGLAYLEDIVTEAVRSRLPGLNLPTPEGFVTGVQSYLAATDPDLLAAHQDLFTAGNVPGVLALAHRLRLPLTYHTNRRETFARFQAAWREAGYSGLVLLLDELSEFLLAKPDSPSFNEDIRFLQFLGEFTPSGPLWIVAAMQEHIEETGAISAEILKKIKDRYPVRFHLSAAHVRSLVEHRLIVKKPAAREAVDRIFERLAASFGQLPFGREEFCALYPVHPLTVQFLQGLSNLFSQHRGVVDFIHHQLRGDPARGIEGLLDQPADTLLTADRIFDHFEDRFQANPELAPYYTTVYRYYRDELPGLFPDAGDAGTAWRVLKLLLLAAVYPYEKPMRLADIAFHLVRSITSLDAGVNFEYLGDILSRLVREGSYVASRPGEDGGPVFFIDLAADVARVIRRELDYVAKGLFDDDERLFSLPARWVTDPALPLADLLVNPVSTQAVEWQNTMRQVYVNLGDLTLTVPPHLEELLARPEADVLVFIGTAVRVREQREHLDRVLLPFLQSAPRPDAVIFWLPRPFDPAEEQELRGLLALALLATKYGRDGTREGEKIRAALSAMQEEKSPRAQEIFKAAYTAGDRITGGGATVGGPSPVFTQWTEVLRHLADYALDRCHPAHYQIMPQSLSFPPTLPQRFMTALLQERGDFTDKNLDPGLSTAFHYLVPMKIARRVGRSYRLDADPRESPLLAAYLAILGPDTVPLAEVFRRLREGEFGLDRNSFLLLSQTLLALGLVQAWKEGHRLNPSQLANPAAFWQVEGLSRGRLVSPETWQAVTHCPLVPPRLAREGLTAAVQEKVWEQIRDTRERRTAELADLAARLRETAQLPALAGLARDARADLQTVEAVLKDIRISYPAREGLEHTAGLLAACPGLGPAWDRLNNLERFLREDLSPFLAMYGYLHSPDWHLPGEWADLAERHRELLRLTEQASDLLDPGCFRTLRERFARFRELYREEYEKEHRTRVGPDCFGAFEAIQSSSGFRLLERFGTVAGLTAEHDLVSAKRLLARVLGLRCTNDHLARDLELSPLCPCGFRPGQPGPDVSAAQVAAAVDAGLREYVAALGEPHRHQKIAAYLAALEAAGKGALAAPVREMLALDPASFNLLEHLERLFTRQTAETLNKALAGHSRQVERSLDELYESLVDRSFAPADLRRRFEAWLTAAGPLGEDDFVRLTGARRTNPSAVRPPGDPLEPLAAEFPELTPLYRRLGPASFGLVLTTVAWLVSYDQPAAEAAALTGQVIPADDLPALEDMAGRLFAGPGELLATARTTAAAAARSIQEEGLADRFRQWQESLVPELIGRVTGERFFPFVFFPALRRLLAHIETAGEQKKLLTTARALQRQSNGNEAFFTGREGIGAAARLAFAFASLAALRSRGAPPEDARGWEQLYRDHLVPLGAELVRAVTGLQKLPLDPPFAPVAKLAESEETTARVARDFARFLAGGAPGLSLAALLSERKRELARKTFPTHTYHILLDGLRLDLWDGVLARLEHGGGRLISHGLTWAALPTTTASQFERLAAQGPDWPRVAAAELAGARAGELADLGREDQIISFGFPDTKIHTAKDDLDVLGQELGQAFEREVLPLWQRLPGQSLVLFFADHGFRENPLFDPRDKYAADRYTHGGDSPWEVLAPWTAWFKLK